MNLQQGYFRLMKLAAILSFTACTEERAKMLFFDCHHYPQVGPAVVSLTDCVGELAIDMKVNPFIQLQPVNHVRALYTQRGGFNHYFLMVSPAFMACK